ncbi:hypothetical protein FE257_009690 [Aspergillus nanangensis]|uniref:Carrier domain-containing protein n=1 Tax=Aspergillus nanangensis TaxID=2582783 RepID=A0AAD4CK35_ASPNN|nr:hypothetical protein FE257_009690 [Aspergillus nanangensis]
MTILFDNVNGGDQRTRPPIDSDALDMAMLEQLKAWNPQVPEACDSLVHELIQQRCVEQPEAPAVCGWDGDLTYLELDTAATSAAEVLASQGDIRPETFIPIYFEKSRWAVVAILAVLKAGAAFVLLDPAHPIKRLKEICISVGAEIIITSTKRAEHATKLVSNVLVVDENTVNWEAPRPMARSLPRGTTESKPENAAYVALTSGSTGTPKAVVNTHRSFCTAALGHGALQGLSPSSRVLQFASYAFATSIREILTTLLFGATICIPSEHDRRENLGDAVQNLRVNWASLSPSVARTVEPDEVPGLKTLLLAGEAATNHDLRRWTPYVSLFCCYGQSECGATSSVYAVPRLDGRPRIIGRGTAGALIWIVDAEDPERLAPIGSVGELLVHGPVVARGYLGGHQMKTVQTFIDAPSWMDRILPVSGSRERLFRTGDLGRYVEDGLIEYVGRKDTQVKLHGQRLEVEEVEHHLRQCLYNKAQDVAVDVITPIDDNESSCLVAFIACTSQGTLRSSEPEPGPWLMNPTDEFRSMAETAKAQLQEQLPLYMVPTCFLPARSLPLAASGKLNRRHLRERGNAMTHRELQLHEYRAMMTTDRPTTEMEKTLQRLWAEVLRLPVDTIGLHDNFWTLGGNSIRAMKLAGLARRHGLSILVGDFWAQPTLREMAGRATSYDELDIELTPFSLLDGEQSQRESLVQSVRQQCGMEESQVEDIYPCTALQAGLVALSAKRPGAYMLAYEYELPPDIDIGRLQAAWAATIKANPILRTRIVLASDGKLYQVVLREHEIPWDTRRSGQAIPSAWQHWQLGQRLIRLALSGSGDQTASFTLLLHHTVTDGWAISLLMEQVQSAYSGSALRPKPFNGFIHYLLRRVQMDHFDAFWKNRLSALHACSFPEFPSPNYDPMPSLMGERVIPLDNTTTNRENQSLAARLQLSWAAVVATYTDSPDVVFGITVSGRGAPVVGIEEMTGPTIATLPFRLVLSATETVKNAINRVQTQSAETIPFEQAGLQRISRLGSDAAAACQFQSLLVIQPAREKSPALFAKRRAILLPYATSTYAITLNCWLHPSHITVIATFDPNVVTTIHMQRMLNQMRHAFQQIAPSSNKRWGDVDLLSPEDLTQLQIWNPRFSAADEQCAHEVIQNKALVQPHAPAVCAWDGDFSYQELDTHASRLACTLIARGVGPESLIPLYFEKTRWILVAILGVLKAGGAFILMDTAHPLERLRNICTDTQAHLVLTSPAREGKAASLGPTTLVVGDMQANWMAEHCSSVPNERTTPDNTTAMYAVFTSGSTGKPKCVVIEHRNFMASVNDKIAAYGLSSKSRVLQFCSYAFDVATFELLITLLAGACICIPSEDEQRDQLGRVTTTRQATIAYMTPTLARALEPKDFPTLQTLVLGGEPVSREELCRWKEKDLRVSYGPAECTVTSSSGRLAADGTGVGYIGFPLGCRFWITSPEDTERLLPVGSTGELLIEGLRVGRGYLKSPDTISGAFMNPPTWLRALHARCHAVYRTGDLVRYNPDGSLTYVGRRDRQVKIRGQRIELGEIEYHVRQASPSIQDVVAEVIFLEQGHRPASLVVFLLLDSQQHSSSIQEDEIIVTSADEDFRGCIATLQPQLADILPASMIPQEFIPITRVPSSTNGKLDRRMLREHASRLSREDLAKFRPEGGGRGRKRIKHQPVTDSQRAVQSVFAQILSVPLDAIGIDDHFFRLGGDSISAMQLAGVARKVGYRMSGSDIFLYPTVKAVAERILPDDNACSDEEAIPPFSLIPASLEANTLTLSAASQCQLAPDQIEDIYPCTPIQEGVTALATRNPGSYVATVIYDVKDEADISRLQDAFASVVRASSIMRTRITYLTNRPYQVVVREQIPWDVYQSREEYKSCPTPVMGPNKRLVYPALIVPPGGGECSLILTIHHALYDGHSLSLFWQAVESAYNSLPLRITPFNRFLKYTLGPNPSEEFWRAQFENLQAAVFPAIPSPGYVPRPDATFSYRIPTPSGEAGSEHTTATMIRLAWGVLQSYYTDSTDVVYGVTANGRTAALAGIEQINGPTVCTFPLRVRVDENATISTVLSRLQFQAASIMQHEQTGLQYIRKCSDNAARACAFQTHLAIQSSSEGVDNQLLHQRKRWNWRMFASYGLVIVCDLNLGGDRGVIDCAIYHDPGLVADDQAYQMMQQFEHILHHIAAYPTQSIRDIPAVGPADWKRLARWNSTFPAASKTLVHTLFLSYAQSHPSEAAVSAWDGELTYGELASQSLQACEFLRQWGVGSGKIVPVCFEKSKWAVVAMLAVLRAGAAVALIDPSHPRGRIHQMLQQFEPCVIVSSASTKSLFADHSTTVLTPPFTRPPGQIHRTLQHSTSFDEPHISPENPAFILFTSGSTGEPKGIIMEHQHLATGIDHHGPKMRIRKGTRALHFSSYAFDLSICEIFTVLSRGGCICVPSEHDRLNRIERFVQKHRVNWMILSPSVIRTLDPDYLPGVETIVLAGEAVNQDIVSHWAPRVTLINAYGPAETTIAVAAGELSALHWEAGTIGPMMGAAGWITVPSDPRRLVPVGAVGELLVEGSVVTRGYLGRPDQTAAAYVDPPPWLVEFRRGNNPGRVYRTGDLARYTPDGHICFLGRRDTLVKLHGQRIELAEIEYHARRCFEGQDVIAETLPAPGRSEQTHAALIVFVVLDEMARSNEDEQLLCSPTATFLGRCRLAEAQLAELLPPYMVPSTFLPISHLPLTVSGKADRSRLRRAAMLLSFDQMEAYSTVAPSLPKMPSTEAEEALRTVWAHVLRKDPKVIGVDDSFFRLGGDSINAMLVVSLCHSAGVSITVEEIFEQKTISRLCACRSSQPVRTPPSTENEAAPFGLLTCEDPCAMIQQAAEICEASVHDIDDIYPCTALQEGLMALSVKNPGQYVSSREFCLQPNVDLQRFIAAWDTTIAANAILRTRLVQLADGETYQVVMKHSTPWRSIESDETAGMKPGSPLMLCSLLGPRFTLTIHHALYDAWSMSMLWDQVLKTYSGRHHIAPVSYKHFIDHIGRHHEDAKLFWQQQFAGLEALPFPILPSPGNVPRPNASLVHAIPCSGYDKGDHTMPTIIQLAWSLVISHHTGSPDVVFGATLDGRRASVAGIQRITGPTITTVPLRVQLNPQETVGESLVSLRRGITAMIPFEQLGLQTIRKLGGEPASACDFQFQLIVQPASRTARENPLVVGGTTRTHRDSYAFSSYALVVICYLDDPLPGDITVHLKYDEKMVAPISAQRLAHQFHHMIAQVCQSQDLQLASLDVINEQDGAELAEWNSSVPKSCNICLHELVLAQSGECPNATAIDAWDGSFTIALCFNRSKWVVVAMLAVLWTGGCCVPLDPTHPRERMRDILHRTNALLLLTDATHYASLSECGGAPVLTIPLLEMPNNCVAAEQNDLLSPNPDSVAFIMFTSGSTGRPKGVVVSHANISTAVREHRHLLQNVGPGRTRAAHLASYAFDVSLAEIFYPLASGGCICIPSEQDRMANLANCLSVFRTNTVFMVPSVLNALLAPDQVPGLQTLILAGEPMSRKVMETWSARVALFNAYGPTESTIFCAFGRVPESGWFPGTIGRAAGCVGWITEPENPSRLMPIGAVGELLVEGPTVTGGYLDDPAETATAYIEPPAWRAQFRETIPDGSRLYRTGDLVRYDSDGCIQFISRRDTQVKIRGQRIELSEIEYHATECFPHPCDVVVELVAVVPQGNGSSVPNLTAFVAVRGFLTDEEDSQKLILPPTDNFRAQAQQAIAQLKSRLPRYMVPSSFLPIARVPRSTSGKINRRMLRNEAGTLTLQDIQGYYMPHSMARRQATTEHELALRQLWADVLRVPVDVIHADNGFFHLGGDSVTAMQLASVARTAGLDLLVVDIFAHPILADLAQTLEHHSAQQHVMLQENVRYMPGCLVGEDTDICTLAARLVKSPVAFTPTSVEDMLPATAFQTSCLDGDNVMYIWLQFSNQVDLDCLERACQRLADHRPILRTAFISSADGYLQVVLDKIDLPAVHLHCESDIDGFMQCLCCRDRSEATLLGAPLFKIYIISQDGSCPRLVMRLSHAQYDGTFLGQLFRDLSAAYCDRPISPSPLPFAKYLHYRHLTSPADRGLFWATYLQGSQMTNLTSPSVQHSRCTDVHPIVVAQREIPLPTTRDGFTVASLSQTTWAYVLAQLTGEKDVVFGTVLNGRDSPFPHMDQVAGPCLAILPIRISIDRTWDTDRLVRHVQDQHVQIMPYVSTDLRDIQRSVPGYASVVKFGSTFNHLKSGTMAPPRIGGADCQWGTTCVEGAAAFLRPSSNFLVRTTQREDTLRIYMCSWEKRIGPEALEDIADRFVQCMKLFADESSSRLGNL